VGAPHETLVSRVPSPRHNGLALEGQPRNTTQANLVCSAAELQWPGVSPIFREQWI